MDLSLQFEHPWDVSPDEAKQIQRRLASEVAETPLPESVETVAGVDVSVRDDTAQAAVAVLRRFDLGVIDRATHRCEVPFRTCRGFSVSAKCRPFSRRWKNSSRRRTCS